MRKFRLFCNILVATLVVGFFQVTKTSAKSVPKVLRQGPFSPFVDLGERRKEIANQPDISKGKLCHFAFYKAGRPEKVVLMSGPISRANINAQSYYTAINSAFPVYLVGDRKVLGKLKHNLSKAAKMHAFEKVKPNNFGLRGYNGYNEGMFHQALLLISLGIALPELERVYGSGSPDVIAIKNWGNRIFKVSNNGRDDFKGKALGVDRAAGKAAAYAVWGISSNNTKALAAGYRLYRFAIRNSIGRRGKISKFGYKGAKKRLYYGNMTYGWATLAADALTKAGLKGAFDVGKRGRSIHNGVDWLVRNIVKSQPKIARNNRTDGSRTLAWMEYYIARFPNRKISKFIEGKLARNSNGMTGGMVGGATTCMVKIIN